VHIITVKHLKEALEKHPDAANDIKSWIKITKAVRWHNFPEVRSTFPDADHVGKFVVFDIRNNRYRLIAIIHYSKTVGQRETEGHIYIRSFLTHKEYDDPKNWDRKYGKK